MGLRPTQEDEKPADQEDLFPPFRTKNKKLWVGGYKLQMQRKVV